MTAMATYPAPFDHSGRVALVTGASGHLGRPMARILAAAGAHVILNGRDPDKLNAFAGELDAEGLSAEPLAFDIRDERAIRVALERIANRHGRLDVVVNNAYSGRPLKWDAAEAEDFESAFGSGVEAAYTFAKAGLPLLEAAVRAEGSASLINIASMYGVVSADTRLYGETGFDSPPQYAAAKGALCQLTRYLACHLAPKRIRVNALAPGPFPRPEIQASHPDFADRLRAKVPMGRLGNPEEIAGPLLFLASDASSFVTGAVLPVDGGWTAW
jgi:NAD(P)-dependent dehydrogenase (short-subunit alcohol dehydrogenase family)